MKNSGARKGKKSNATELDNYKNKSEADLFHDGLEITEIAAIKGVHPSTIYRRLEASGIKSSELHAMKVRKTKVECFEKYIEIRHKLERETTYCFQKRYPALFMQVIRYFKTFAKFLEDLSHFQKEAV